MGAETLYVLGIGLILVGISVLVAATLLLFLSGARREGKMKGGGAVIIGPIPIVFGTDKESIRKILLLSLALTVALAALMVIYYLVIK
jgi:uncharacterized protein (TIGR00304 family)